MKISAIGTIPSCNHKKIKLKSRGNNVSSVKTVARKRNISDGLSVNQSRNISFGEYRITNDNYDYTVASKGTAFPYNERVLVDSDAKILIDGETELDLGSDYVKEYFSKYPDGTPFLADKRGEISVSSEYTGKSDFRAIIAKSKDGYIVKDISEDGIKLSYNGFDYNEYSRFGDTGKILSEKYLRNSRKTCKYLERETASGNYTKNKAEYIQRLTNAHALLYYGKTGKDFWYKTKSGYVQTDPYLIDSRPTGAISSDFDAANVIDDLAKYYGDNYRASLQTSTVNLKGISKNALPVNSGSAHIYPEGKYTDEYIDKMYETARDTVKLINEGAPKEKIISKTAEHFQYAVNARPYKCVNSELFIDEANAFLKTAGIEPLHLGLLDHAALRLQPDTFIKYFSDCIKS